METLVGRYSEPFLIFIFRFTVRPLSGPFFYLLTEKYFIFYFVVINKVLYL